MSSASVLSVVPGTVQAMTDLNARYGERLMTYDVAIPEG